MPDEAFQHKFWLRNEWEMAFFFFLHQLSLFQLPVCLFVCFFPLNSLSSFQSRFLPRRFLYRHLPMSAHLRGTNIWEMQFEHFGGTKGRQTMLEKWGDKRVAELMPDKHVALPSIHKRPCHVRRSQVWKSKDEREGARGPRRFWASAPAELVSLLFGRFSPWGTSSFKTTAQRRLFLPDKNRQKCLPSNVELADENKRVRLTDLFLPQRLFVHCCFFSTLPWNRQNPKCHNFSSGSFWGLSVPRWSVLAS